MPTKTPSLANIPQALLDEIDNFPAHREVSHCGSTWLISPFEFYAICPECKSRMKVRSFAGRGSEIEDVFDAVFAWMGTPEGRAAAEARIEAIKEDD